MVCSMLVDWRVGAEYCYDGMLRRWCIMLYAQCALLQARYGQALIMSLIIIFEFDSNIIRIE